MQTLTLGPDDLSAFGGRSDEPICLIGKLWMSGGVSWMTAQDFQPDVATISVEDGVRGGVRVDVPDLSRQVFRTARTNPRIGGRLLVVDHVEVIGLVSRAETPFAWSLNDVSSVVVVRKGWLDELGQPHRVLVIPSRIEADGQGAESDS